MTASKLLPVKYIDVVAALTRSWCVLLTTILQLPLLLPMPLLLPTITTQGLSSRLLAGASWLIAQALCMCTTRPQVPMSSGVSEWPMTVATTITAVFVGCFEPTQMGGIYLLPSLVPSLIFPLVVTS